MVWEWHQSKDINAENITDIINYSEIFTTEMKDNTNYWNICDYTMVSLQAFLRYHQHFYSHIISEEKILTYYYTRSQRIFPEELEHQ